jgi:hypothetical protein
MMRRSEYPGGGARIAKSRRDLLPHLPGVVIRLASVGHGLSSAAFATQPQRRREVVINGKRLRAVDATLNSNTREVMSDGAMRSFAGLCT